MNTQLTNPGDRITYPAGRVTITLQYVRPGAYTIELLQGGTYRVADLCSAHADERTARSRARMIAVALKSGISVEQLAIDRQNAQADALAQADAILDEALAGVVTDRTDDELVAALNADFDAVEAATKTQADELRADIAGIMADANRAVGRLTLADTVPTGDRPQVRPTMAGAHLTAETDPQLRALIIAHVDGAVYRNRSTPWAVLNAAGRKGYLHLHSAPGARKANWSHGTLAPAGARLLAVRGLIDAAVAA